MSLLAKTTRIITALCRLPGMFSTLNAAEPRMEKAIQLLQQAKVAPNPVPLLEKAREHLQNATRNKGGNRVEAVKTINQAIKAANKGGNVKAQNRPGHHAGPGGHQRPLKRPSIIQQQGTARTRRASTPHREPPMNQPCLHSYFRSWSCLGVYSLLSILAPSLWADPAQSLSIGFNFVGGINGNPSAPAGRLKLTERAGVPEFAQENWNNLITDWDGADTGAAPNAESRNDCRGRAVPGLKLWWNAPNVWSVSQSVPTDPNLKLLNGYLDSNDSGDGADEEDIGAGSRAQPYFSVAGLSPEFILGGYKVIVYQPNFTDNAAASFWLTTNEGGAPSRAGDEVNLTQRYYYKSNQPFTGTYVRALSTDGSNITSGNYLQFDSQVTPSFTLRSEEQNFRSRMSAVQIVKNPTLTVTTLEDEFDAVGTVGRGLSLREAVRDAANGSGILFAPGLAGGRIMLTSQIAVPKSLVIDASNLPGGITIDTVADIRLFAATSDPVTGALSSVTFRGVTLTCSTPEALASPPALAGADVSGGGGGGVVPRVNEPSAGRAIDAGNVALLIVQSTVRDCWVPNAGGAIYSYGGGQVACIDTLITRNRTTASSGGGQIAGGAFVTEGLAALRSEFSDNSCARGGGAVSADRVKAVRSTFIGNSGGFGGALATLDKTDLRHSTFTGNRASQAGAAIYYDSPLSLKVFNCTITGNTAPLGGGIEARGQVTGSPGINSLRNCLVAGNVGGDLSSASGTVNAYGSLGGNKVGVATNANGAGASTALFTQPGDVRGLTAGALRLAPLGFYGGGTRTMLPLPGSPALEGGIADGTVIDQRGFNRTADGDGNGSSLQDSGAVESEVWVVTTAVDELDAVGVTGSGLSLREALREAPMGAVVTFASGLNGQTLWLTNQLEISRSVIIDASTLSRGVTLHGNGQGFRLLDIRLGATVALSGLTFTGGGSPGFFESGGAIRSDGPLHLTRCTLHGNQAAQFGGAIMSDGPVNLTLCTLANNVSGLGGGAVCAAARAEIFHCTIAYNTTSGPLGGGLLAQSGAEITQSIISGNEAATESGAVLQTSGKDVAAVPSVDLATYSLIPSMKAIIFSGLNQLQLTTPPLLTPLGNYGGPTPTMLLLPGSPGIDGGEATWLETDQRGYVINKDGDGNGTGRPDLGATDMATRPVTTGVDSGSGSLRQVIAAAQPGEIITLPAAATLSGSSMIEITKPLALVSLLNGGSVIDGGSGTSRIFQVAPTGSLSLHRTTLRGGGSLGALMNQGRLELYQCTLSGNSAPNTDGGGLLNYGEARLVNCTIRDNTAVRGAAVFQALGSLMMNQCTVTRNSATSGGGAIYSDGGLTIIDRCTVNGNTAAGGVINANTAVTLLGRSIVAGGMADSAFNARSDATAFRSQGYNILGTGSNIGTQTTDRTGVEDPRLLPLADNGGGVLTLHPAPGSPAIDAGGPAFAAGLDQRGFSRVSGGQMDSGSVEAFFGPSIGYLAIRSLTDFEAVPVTDKVEVVYDLADAQASTLNVAVEFSRDGGLTWATASGLTGDFGPAVARGSRRVILWDAKASLGEVFSSQVRVRLTATGTAGFTPAIVSSENLTLDTRLRNIPVRGRVLQESGAPLAGATVSIGTLPAVTTDAAGNYTIPDVPRAGGLLTVSRTTYSNQYRELTNIPGLREHIEGDITLTRLAFRVTSVNRNAGGLYLAGDLPFDVGLTTQIDWGQRQPARVEYWLGTQLVHTVTNSGASHHTTINTANLVSGFTPYTAPDMTVVAIAADGERSTAFVEPWRFVGVTWLDALPARVYREGTGAEPRYSVVSTWPPVPNPLPTLAVFGPVGPDFSVNMGVVYAPGSGMWEFWLGDPGQVRSDWRPRSLDEDAAGFNIAYNSLNMDLRAFARGRATWDQGFGLDRTSVSARLGYNAPMGEICLTHFLEPTGGLKTLIDICDAIGYDFNSLQCIRFSLDLEGRMDAFVAMTDGNLHFEDGSFIASATLSGYYRPDLGGWINVYGQLSGSVALTLGVPNFEYRNTRLMAMASAGASLDMGILGEWGASGEWVLVDVTFGPQSRMARSLGSKNLAIGEAPTVEAWEVKEKRLLSELPPLPPEQNFVANEPSGANAMAKLVTRKKSAASPAAATGGEGSALTTLSVADRTLVQNIEGRTDHALAGTGTTLLEVYSRPSATPQQHELVWTQFNGTTWSTPAVIPGATSVEIFDPSLSYDGAGNAIVTWQQVSSTPPAGSDLKTVMKLMEVKWSRLTSGAWTAAASLTGNSLYDGEAKLCGPLSDGDLFCLWRQKNPTGDGYDYAKGGSLMSARWDTATLKWTAATAVDSAFTGGFDWSTGSGAGKVVLTWMADADGDHSTTKDTEIYARVWSGGAWGAITRVTNDAVADRTPRTTVTTSGQVMLAWLHDADLVWSRDFGATSVLQAAPDKLGMADLQFTVNSAGLALLLWSETRDMGSDARYCLYDPAASLWGEPTTLWGDANAERAIRLYWDPAGKLQISCLKELLVPTTQQLMAEDPNGNIVPITAENVVQVARTDLLHSTKTIVSDLSIKDGDFSVSDDMFVPGATLSLKARIRNSGDRAVLNPALRFTYTPISGGPAVTIATCLFSGWLAAQESHDCTAAWLIPPGTGRGTFTAIIDPDHGVAEADEGAADNERSVLKGGTDLIVSYKSHTNHPNATGRVIATVFNAGSPASPASTLQLRRGDGTLVASAAVPAIASADAYDVVMDLTNYQTLPIDTYTLRIDPATVSDVEPNNNESGFTGEIDRWIEITGTMQYQQDFNGLEADTDWIDNGLLHGWMAQINSGNTATGLLRAGDGSTNQNGLLYLGTTGTTDRALGSKAANNSNLANIAYAAAFRNTSSTPVKLARLRYAEELWRSGSVASTPEKITAFYAITATPLTNIASGISAPVAVAGADFVSLPPAASTAVSSSTTNTALDGNLALNRSLVDYTPAAGSEIIIPPGAYFTLKWTDSNEANVIDGHQGIDDVIVEFTETVPTPLVLGSATFGGNTQPLQTTAEVVNFRQTAANEVSIISGTGILLTEPTALTPGSEKCLTMTLVAQDTDTASGFETADTLRVEALITTPGGVITQSLIGDYDIDQSGALTGGATPAADEFNLGQQAVAVKWISSLPLVATIPKEATSFQLRITAVLDGNAPDTSTEAFRFKDVAVTPCLDSDGDGLHDGLEWAHGTNPNLNSSFLRLQTVSVSGNQLSVLLPSVASRDYQTMASPDLGTWARSGTPSPGTGGPLTILRPLSGARFLRVLAHPPQTIIP